MYALEGTGVNIHATATLFSPRLHSAKQISTTNAPVLYISPFLKVVFFNCTKQSGCILSNKKKLQVLIWLISVMDGSMFRKVQGLHLFKQTRHLDLVKVVHNQLCFVKTSLDWQHISGHPILYNHQSWNIYSSDLGFSYVCFSLCSNSCCCLINRSISVPRVCRLSFEEKRRHKLLAELPIFKFK